MAAYYLRVMDKYSDTASTSVSDAQTWIEKEVQRLGKLMSRKGAIAGKKMDELKMKQNVRFDPFARPAQADFSSSDAPQILAAFKYVEAKAEEVKEAVQDGAEAVADKAEAVVDRIKQEL